MYVINHAFIMGYTALHYFGLWKMYKYRHKQLVQTH